MKITVLCVGKIREKFYIDAVNEYFKRMGRYAKVNVIEVEDEKTPDHASEALENQIKHKESDRLKRYIKESQYVIALDIYGSKCNSIQFSNKIEKLMTFGKSHIVFIIGGSLGLHSSILDCANEKISFSEMTFPHQLMRVILFEQIYRAMKIMKNEPYHK